MAAEAFDFIIVGAGSAGCVLANRLSADPGVQVLLVEAGPAPRGLWTRMPAGVSRLIFPGPLNWGWHTEPEAELQQRRIYAPRGRGLGGSSLINGMAHFRGQPQDYDSWAAFGVEGWGWDDVLPAFRRMEHRPGGVPPWRGQGGELWVTDARWQHPASDDFVRAAVNAGEPANSDFNGDIKGGLAEGAGRIQFNIRDGRRHSAELAFLTPVRSRANLCVMTEALVERVRFDGTRATGITLRQGGAVRHITARREVLLCAGALATPALLLRSGVGPAADLQALGIAVVADSPGVGRNLQDHLYIHHTHAVTPQSSANADLSGWRALLHGAHYLLTRRGLLTMGASQVCAFVRSRPDVERADLQIAFRPLSWQFAPDGTLRIGHTPQTTTSVCLLRPESRGAVTLAGTDPQLPPRVQARYASTPRDRATAVRAVRRVRRLMAQAPMAARVQAELAPGPACQSDDEIVEYVRQTAQSMHHWVGSCSMGSGPQAVVDSHLRVHGVAGLRVVDASVMPLIPSANTNAPSCMLAERAAPWVKGGV
jgi:choline dehydrogenase